MNNSPLKWCAAALLSAVVSSVFAGASHSGVVLETMNSGGYTYAKIDEGAEPFWIAGPPTSISKGDKVNFAEQMWMKDFSSSTLHRTFDRILFVGAIGSGTGAAAPATGQPAVGQPPAAGHPVASQAPAVPVEPVEKAEGGYTVAELYARKSELNGQTVKVHGRVVKVLKQIMSANWVHIQDGTGDAKTRDIIFRCTGEVPAVGDVVLAEGKLVADKDLGFGMVYPVLVEESHFTK